MQVSWHQEIFGAIAEHYPRLALALGRLETRWLQHELSEIPIDRPIFVSGLARAGSTILLECLARHPATASHRYRDFPFLHFPVWWSWFVDRASHGESVAMERSHKDGIYVTPDSPEAMEEILWMAHFRRCHDTVSNNVLKESDEHQRFEQFYRDHIRKLLLLRGGARYLSKGNYNLSRLKYLKHLFSEVRFVVPLREPVSHIGSLIKQHQLFCEAESRNPRVRSYMRRSGHFEFGLDRRPINLSDGAVTRRIEQLWREGEEVAGWAAYWASVYNYVASLLQSDQALARRTLIVKFDELCRHPAKTLGLLYAHCELEITPEFLAEQAAKIREPTYYDPNFTEGELATIYRETGATMAEFAK